MTGYGRATGAAAGVAVAIDIRSVNGRGLDVRLRLPPGYDALEPQLRQRIGNAVSRGSIALTLTVDRETAGGTVVINRQALGAVLAALQELDGVIDAQRPTLDGILSLKGVLEQRETPMSPDDEEVLTAAILECADRALAALVAARQSEGAALATIFRAQLDEIAALTEAAASHPGRTREVVLERLRRQVDDLLGASPALGEERLAAEAMLLATRADISEELDRLTAHVAAARKLLDQGGAAGRRLDFLSQEFNREANTLCSKANAVELTAIGLDLKAVIDRFREQVQNIE